MFNIKLYVDSFNIFVDLYIQIYLFLNKIHISTLFIYMLKDLEGPLVLFEQIIEGLYNSLQLRLLLTASKNIDYSRRHEQSKLITHLCL